MERKFEEYIIDVIKEIDADYSTKKKIRQSLTEHLEILIEKHGSLADKYIEPAEIVAAEFRENLGLDRTKEVERPWWFKRRAFSRRISGKKIFNLPLYHITDGYNPDTNNFEVAKGVIAVGPVALGVFAWGGLALGIFSFGGFSIGLLLALGGAALALGGAIGGLAVGGMIAAGGMALSYGLAFGGYAIGYIAIGDMVQGEYIYDTSTGEGNAVEWFARRLPYFLKFFK